MRQIRWNAIVVLGVLIMGCRRASPASDSPIEDPLPPTRSQIVDESSPVVPQSGDSVIITEILAHTDLPQVDSVELYNPTDSAIDISGWYITDSPKEPQMARLPAGTVVGAREYLVLTQRNWGTEFAFSDLGEDVYVYSADPNKNLTGYTDGGKFGASPNGQSLVRIETANGVEFALSARTTLGADNAPPQIGPLVISEIMYEGGGSTDEYIVIENITAQDVALFHPEYPQYVWELRKGVTYEFPTNSTLPAYSKLIITRDEPDFFRTTEFNLPADIQVFGPFSGKLKNSGERVILARPDKPDKDFVPYVTVDTINYTDVVPWPLILTDGSMSIRRVHLDRYGNDPTNWQPHVLTADQWVGMSLFFNYRQRIECDFNLRLSIT